MASNVDDEPRDSRGRWMTGGSGVADGRRSANDNTPRGKGQQRGTITDSHGRRMNVPRLELNEAKYRLQMSDGAAASRARQMADIRHDDPSQYGKDAARALLLSRGWSADKIANYERTERARRDDMGRTYEEAATRQGRIGGAPPDPANYGRPAVHAAAIDRLPKSSNSGSNKSGGLGGALRSAKNWLMADVPLGKRQ
jgi:hypothetical protein